jgi:hypothetical protein
VYTNFSGDYNALGIKPVDDNHLTQYQNSDHAGTPEAFRKYVIGGAIGGGGSNYTGSYSSTGHVTPAPLPPPPPPPASLSGVVSLGGGLAGVVITLTGVNDLGQTVTLTTTTDVNGDYSFAGLQPGTYKLSEAPPPGTVEGSAAPGTVNGSTEGSAQPGGAIGGITLSAGDNGVDYDFFDLYAGS